MRELKPSQFVRGYNPDNYTYIENGSKNHKGTFGNSKDSNKVVTILATNDWPKCVVYLLDFYFKRLPKPPEDMEFFFAKPLDKVPSDRKAPWFHSLPVGKNTLGGTSSYLWTFAKKQESKRRRITVCELQVQQLRLLLECLKK